MAFAGFPLRHAVADEALPIAEIKHEGEVDFEKEILPLLRRNCVACHNATEAESDLVLESPETILKGGIEGPGVIPGNADESLVFQLAAHQRESFMPPEDNDVGAKNFTPEELGLFKLWINQGAKASASASGQAIAWQPLPEGVNPIYAVAVTPHGRFAAAGRANQISVYSVLAQQELGRLTDPELIEVGLYDKPGVAHRDAVQSLAFTPNGRQLASGGFRNVKFWNRNDSLRHAEWPTAAADIQALAVSADGQRAAVAQADGKLQVYDVASGKIVHSLASPAAPLASVAFSPDASRLVGGAVDGTVSVWNLADGAPLGQLRSPSPVNAVTVVNEGRQIVTGGFDGILRLWEMPAAGANPAAPQPIREMPGHTAPVTALAPLPGQPHVFVSASFDGTARQWDANSGKEIRQYAHGVPLCDVAVRPDGKRIATAAEIGTTKLWNAEDGKQLAELTTDSEPPHLLADLQRAVELAGRHVQNAKADLDAGIARQAAEAANADKSAVQLVRAELTAKQKAEAAAKATADKVAAEQELAELKKQLEAAKAPAPPAAAEAKPEAKPAAEPAAAETTPAAEPAAAAATPAAEPAAEGKPEPAEAKPAAEPAAPEPTAPEPTAEELKKQTEKLIAELTEKIKVAEKKVTDLTAPAQKAIDEQKAAAEDAETAKRSVETARKAVERMAAEVPRLKEAWAARQRDQQAATDLLAQTQQDSNSRKARVAELVAQKVEADRAALAAQTQLRTAEAARRAATDGVVAANQNALATLAAQAQAEAAAAAAEAPQPVAADATAEEKAAAEKAAAEKLAAAKAAAAQATAAHAAALAAMKQAAAQFEAAEKAYAGPQGLAATATAIAAELDKQLAAAKATVPPASENPAAENPATEDPATKAAQAAVVEYLSAQRAEVSRLAAEAAEQSKATAAQKAEAARVFAEARTALLAAAANAVQVSDQTQRAARAAGVAKTAADLAATEADAQNKAATTRKDAAAAALKTAQETLAKAADELAKAVAAAEVENATRNQTAADAAAVEAAAALKAAGEAKAAAEKAVADTQAESQKLQAAANQTLAAAKATYTDARNKLAAADTAAGGAQAVVATANEVAALATTALAEVQRPVAAVAFSPSGAQLAVAGGAGRVDFYSSEAGVPLHQLNSAGDTPAADAAPAAGFVAAAYVGGERLLTAAEDRGLAVWAALPVWSLQRKIGSVDSPTPFVNRVTALAFSPNGELLATGGGEPSRSGELQIWNVASGELVHQIADAHSDTVFAVAFSDDGKYLASCGADRFMKVFETATGKFVKSFEGHTHHVLGVSWRADGRMLATAGADNVIKVWDFNTGEGVRTIAGFKKELTAIDFLGVSDNFVVTTGDNQVLTRNTGGGSGPAFPGATDFMYSLRATLDGKIVVAGGQDSVLRVWDQAGKSIVTFAPHK